MATYSAEQIAAVAKGAGFAGDALVLAVAVALAESSGRTDVVNSIGCVGLWQINQPVHVKAHPQWTRAWLQNPANNAAAAYSLSSGGRNWRPWEAYTNGMYVAQMGRARLAAGRPDSSGVTNANTVTPAATVVEFAGFGDFLKGLGKLVTEGGGFVPSPGEALDAAGNVAKALVGIAKGIASLVIGIFHVGAWLANPHNWLRIVQVAGGGVAVFIGLKMLAGTGAGPAADVAGAAVKSAKAVATRGASVAKSARGSASGAAKGAAKGAGTAAKTATKTAAKTAASAAKAAAK